jgi:hypothetical protein
LFWIASVAHDLVPYTLVSRCWEDPRKNSHPKDGAGNLISQFFGCNSKGKIRAKMALCKRDLKHGVTTLLMPTPVTLCKPSVLFRQNLATRPELNCSFPALHLSGLKSFSQYLYMHL